MINLSILDMYESKYDIFGLSDGQFYTFAEVNNW